MRLSATPFWVALLALVLVALAPTGQAQAPTLTASPQALDAQRVAVAGQIQVKLTPQAQQQVALNRTGRVATAFVPPLSQLNAQLGATTMRRVFRPAGRHEARHAEWGLDRWYVVEFNGPVNAESAAAAYQASPAVEVASRIYEKQLHGQRVTLDGPPNDTYYDRQWHYDNDGTVSPFAIADADIDAPEGWALETGLPDVVVQIIDSGIDTDHPDLAGALWVNPGEDLNGNGVFDNAPAEEGGDLNGIDDDGNGFVDDLIGYNHADDLATPEAGLDSEFGSGSHGVHTAGTVGARTNNGVGVAGVAGGDGTADSGVRLMISMTFGNDAVDGFAEAIVYAADNGAVISNNSWGYGQAGAFEPAVLDAIDYFTANAGGPDQALDGGLFVASAGNDGTDEEWYPGFYEPTLAVSSLGVANQRSLFNSTGSSNFGAWVDVAGPGGDFATNNVVEELILSTVIQGEAVNTDLGDYDYYQGTSMSGPHVAGIAALVASYEFRRGTTLTQAQLRARVASPNTTKDIDGFNPGFEGQLGVGMASAFLAITNPAADGTAPDQITDLSVDDVVGNAVQLSFTVPEDSEAPAVEDGVVLQRVTGLDLRYSTEPITEDNFGDAFVAQIELDGPLEAGQEIDVTIQNLSYNETYYFAVRSTDRFGNVSAISNVVSAVTGDAPFSVEPTAFDVTLASGEEESRDMTITNESARTVEFDIEIVGSASVELEYTPPGLTGDKLDQWRLANERAWAGDYPRGEADGADSRMPAPAKLREAGPQRMDAPMIRPYADPVLIAASSFNLFENTYGTFDLGTPEDWDVLSNSFTDFFAADYIRGVDDRLYAFECASGFFGGCTSNAFGTLDPNTGDFTVIKAEWENGGFPIDMTGDLTTGDLYVYTSLDEIHRVDRFTGETELVTTAIDAGGVIAVAIDDQGVMYGHDVADDVIVTIDLETGALTEVGPTGFDARFIQGMDFDPTTGRLYLAAYNVGVAPGQEAELRIASRETGNSVLVGKINGGDGEYAFLAVPGEGFVTTNVTGVTLRAGRSIDVDVTFDAALLLAGDYTAALRVAARGLPGSPTVDVPVALTVTGDPVATVDPDSLDFGEVFVNGTERRDFLIRNEGVDDLVVTGITTTDPAFVVTGSPESETSFTLEPGESERIEVEFTPTALGEQSATLTVATNDPANPALVIDLVGVGTPAPEIAVAPTEFDLQAFSGQTYTRTFEISNTGGDTLTYLISEQDVTQDISEPIVLFGEDFENGFPDDWVVATNGDPAVTWQLASEYGRPTDPNYASSGDAAMADSDGPQGPGAPGYDTQMWTPEITLDDEGYNLDYTISFNSIDAGDRVDVDISTDNGETWTTMIAHLDDTCAGSCFGTPSGVAQSIPLDGFVEDGDSFRVRWRYYTTDGTGWDWWATIDDVAVVRNVEWLSLDRSVGAIAPGESETVTITIDADLPEGEYGVDLLITSNDPTSNGVFIDVDLTVVESLTVTPSPGADDLEVNPNEEFLVPITVASLQDLGVESYQFTLTFDEDLLVPLGIVTDGTLSEGTSFSVNTDQEGEISVAVAENSGAQANSAPRPVLFDIEAMDIDGDNPILLFVSFRAAEALGETELAFESFQFNEGQPPVTPEVATVTVVPLYGDVSLNLDVSSFDASLVLDAVVGLVELNAAAQEAADVSGNGEISALDASLILRFAVNNPSVPCFPADPACDSSPGVVVASARVADSGQALTEDLAWGTPTAAKATAGVSGDDLVRVPLVFDGAGSVYAVDFEVDVDPARATVAGVEASLPDGWFAAHRVEDGVLRIAFSGSTPLGAGEIAAVTLDRHMGDAALTLAGEARFDEASPMRLAAMSAEELPMTFSLRGNYPNPTAGAAVISLDLPEGAAVRMELFDTIGRRVMMVQEDFEAGARRELSFSGSSLPAGVYIYRVTAEMGSGTESAAGRMTIVR